MVPLMHHRENDMSEDQSFEKDFGPIDSARERSGIYGLGFDPISFIGFMIPILIVGALGLVGGLLIWKFL